MLQSLFEVSFIPAYTKVTHHLRISSHLPDVTNAHVRIPLRKRLALGAVLCPEIGCRRLLWLIKLRARLPLQVVIVSGLRHRNINSPRANKRIATHTVVVKLAHVLRIVFRHSIELAHGARLLIYVLPHIVLL
jgi:hypothetical protein